MNSVPQKIPPIAKELIKIMCIGIAGLAGLCTFVLFNHALHLWISGQKHQSVDALSLGIMLLFIGYALRDWAYGERRK